MGAPAVRHLQQQHGFTCGPVALLMAMRALGRDLPETEVYPLWREATLAAGKATSPEGLALAAVRRGFHARVVRKEEAAPLEARVLAKGGEPDVLRDFFADTVRRAAIAGVLFDRRRPTDADLRGALEAGTPCLVLTDARHFDPSEPSTPHWVVALGLEDGRAAIHDPGLVEGPTMWPARDLGRVIGFGDDAALVVVAPGHWP